MCQKYNFYQKTNDKILIGCQEFRKMSQNFLNISGEIFPFFVCDFITYFVEVNSKFISFLIKLPLGRVL